jgi:hypothetical protein
MARAAAAFGAASVGLVTVACGPAGAAKLMLRPSAQPSGAATSPRPAATPSPVAPLTGLPSSAAVAARPAVALPVTGGHPSGLSAADVVFEEISNHVRYVAVFQSRQARRVGPITGTLPSDGQILSVLHPLTGYSSGTPSFIKVLHRTSVVDVGYPAHSSLYSDGGVVASTSNFAHAARASAPPPLFSYRGADSGSTVLATAGQWRPTSVTVTFPRGGSRRWVFEQRANQWAEASGGPPARVANLVIQTVRYKTVYLSRKLRLTAPSARVMGRGRVEVFTGIGGTADRGPGGLAAAGEWSKPGLRDVTQFLDARGYPMALQPGPTWVILAPLGTKIKTSETAAP